MGNDQVQLPFVKKHLVIAYAVKFMAGSRIRIEHCHSMRVSREGAQASCTFPSNCGWCGGLVAKVEFVLHLQLQA